MSDSPIRITFLSPIGSIGGAERVLLDVMASLRDVLPSGSSMHLICMSEGALVAEARALGASVEVLPLPPRIALLGESGLRGKGRFGKLSTLAARSVLASPAAIAYVRRLRRTVAASRADVIHTNGIKAHLLSRFLPRSAGRVVWHIHDLLGTRPLLAGSLKYAAGHVYGAIAISQSVADDLKQVLPGKLVFTVLNGVDINHFSPAPANGSFDAAMLDGLANLPPAEGNIVRVGLIATYARWKGQHLLLEAAAQIPSPGVRFYIIGGSIYQTSGSSFSRAELQQHAAALGISDRVGLIDFQTDPLPIYRALDVVVHASVKPEPFGRTIAEGMSCGRAVIVSAAGGALELFTDGVDALGTPPGDLTVLTENMRRLIDDPALRRSLGTHARATAVIRFDRKRLGPELLSIYQRVCAIKPGAPA